MKHVLQSEYPKISAVRKRDPKTNQPTEEFASQHFDPIYGLGALNWTWREKMDGTNLRILWDGHRVEVRGRTNRAEFSKANQEYLNERLLSREFEELIEQTFGNTEVAIYGELVGPKVNGNRHALDALDIFIFDAWVDGWWLLPEAVDEVAESLGLKVPRRLDPERISLVEEFVRGLARHGEKLEGFVGTPPGGVLDRSGKPIRVKVKTENYR